MSQATNNSVQGEIKSTPQLISRTDLNNRAPLGYIDPTQKNYLTFETAPRNTETTNPVQSSHSSYSNNLSYKAPLNTVTNNSTYNKDEINPMRTNLARPAANPYFLFLGKFASQSVQNTDPSVVGHYDAANAASGVWQQPSNIYNIPDNPKDYVLIRNVDPQSNSSSLNLYPNEMYNDIPSSITSSNAVIYDASSCPVNWRMYHPVRSKVYDWSNNGVPANYVNFKAGRYVLPSGATTFSNSTNPAARNVAGVYFNETQFDVSYNPTSQPNAYFELKPSFVSSLGSGSGSGGTGTDLSFNNYFFKQPEMIPDCSAVFQSGAGGSGRDRLYISWDLPFHRKTGQNLKQEGKRYFYEDGESPYENWLPHFSELIFDISGGQNNRKFCQDICGNLLHTGGDTTSGYSATPFAILSANNRFISLEATSGGGGSSITTQWAPGGAFKHGTNGQTTTIVDNFTASPTSGNYAGGSPQAGDIGLGYMYDIALYYRNESKLNTQAGLASTDLYYNKHNPCIMRNIIFGVPGFISSPSSLEFFQASGSTGSGNRYYLGGSGPATKDTKSPPTPAGEGLNLVWGNTALIKVGYDCSLNFTRNRGTERVQVGGINGNTGIMLDYAASNGGLLFDISYNIFPNPVNMRMTSAGTNSPATLRHWPSGGNGTTPSWNAPDSAFDFIKILDEIGNVPTTYSGSHPEHKYVANDYHAVNDTPDASGNLVRASSSASSTKIVPIFSRSVCNTTGESGYNNVMPAAVNTWSPTIDFVDESSATPSYTTAFTKSVRRRIGGNSENVYFISGKKKLSFIAATPLNPYRQLANFGSPTSAPTTQTLANLIDSTAYIGTTAKNTKIGQVDFVLNQKPSSGSKTNLGSTTTDIYGWNNMENLTNTNNPLGGKLSIDPTYELELGVGQVLDIAKNETGFGNGYTNKEGYYLGFDISSCVCYVDLSNNYTDTALLGRSTTAPFKDGYDKYELELKHIVEKRGTTSSSTIKSLQFHVGEDISRNISISNIQKGTMDIASNGLTNFFGIKRLPGKTIADGRYKDTAASSTSHLEMHMRFQLDNVSKRWIPPNTSDYGNNIFAKVQFCVDPAGTSPIDLDANPGSVTGNTFEVEWNDSIVIGSNAGSVSSSIFFNNTSGMAIGSTPSVASPFFAELTEGQSGIVGDDEDGDGHYSRLVTGNSRALLGLKDLDTSASTGHIKFGNNFKVDKTTWDFKYKDITTLGFTAGNKYLFGGVNGDSGKELFWDYTFQVDTDNGKLPSRTISGKAQFDSDLRLQETNKSSAASTTEHVLASEYSTLPSNYIFGSINFELLNLEAILKTSSGYSNSGANYDHSKTLNDYQSMWCNTAFRGPVSLSNQGGINDPYINYNTLYYGQTVSSYPSKNSSGLILNGSTGLSSAFVIHTDTNSSGGAGKPSGTPSSFTGSGNYKVILLRINNMGTNSRFDLKIFGISGSTSSIMTLGSDYFLFYGEYHSTDSSAYVVRYASGSGTAGTKTSAFSGWLQPFTFGGFAANTIKTIEYSSSQSVGTRGSESGCADPSVSGWSVQQTNPSIKCFNTGNNVSKFVAIYIPEDKNIHRIELNKKT